MLARSLIAVCVLADFILWLGSWVVFTAFGPVWQGWALTVAATLYAYAIWEGWNE